MTCERCQLHGADRMWNRQWVYSRIIYLENLSQRGGEGRNAAFLMFSKAVSKRPCQNWEIVWKENSVLSWVLSHDEWPRRNWICLTTGAVCSKSSCVDFVSAMTLEMEAFPSAFLWITLVKRVTGHSWAWDQPRHELVSQGWPEL